jgi:hypothetical protein
MNSEAIKYFLLPEEKYIQYNNRVYEEQLVIKNLLFDEPMLDGREPETYLFCECYSTLKQMRDMLDNIEETYNSENCEFYISEAQMFKISILLSSLLLAKEELLKNNVSISIH